MFAALSVDGEPTAVMGDDAESVQLEFDPEACAPQYRCRACGEELTETTDGWESETGDACCRDFEPTYDGDPDFGEGPHDPERIPLSWCNRAGITTDADEDSVTVAVSVGDPRGQFTLTLRRIPDDADSELAGHLVMHVPYPGEPCPHMQTTALHPGTYLVGSEPAAARKSEPDAA